MIWRNQMMKKVLWVLLLMSREFLLELALISSFSEKKSNAVMRSEKLWSESDRLDFNMTTINYICIDCCLSSSLYLFSSQLSLRRRICWQLLLGTTTTVSWQTFLKYIIFWKTTAMKIIRYCLHFLKMWVVVKKMLYKDPSPSKIMSTIIWIDR